MTGFTLIKVGDNVHDRKKDKTGVVQSISYDNNTAIVKTDQGSNEILVSKLHNLTQLSNFESLDPDADDYFGQVKEFQLAFGHPVADSPSEMDLERAVPRTVWTAEEVIAEYLHASSDNEEQFLQACDDVIAGLEKAKEKSMAMEYYEKGIPRLVAQADALTDGLYFIFGSFVELGIKPKPLFKIVQNSNMSKLFTAEDGTKYAKYRPEDGKILKSPEFFAPEGKLEAEIVRQFNSKK